MPSMETFGQKFRAYRNFKKVSGWHIEKVSGISRSNLSNMEAGRIGVSDEMLRKLSAVPELDISYEKLKAWWAAAEFGLEVLQEALKIVDEERRDVKSNKHTA